MKFISKIGCLTVIIPIAIGIMIIVTSIEISKRGHDYPILIYVGLAISFVGIFLTSLWFWDFIRGKLGLGNRR